jgi:hypothetical protein
MKSKFKVNQRVKVFHETHPFEGTIEIAMKWENPFSILAKKGTNYAVRADDDKVLYDCEESLLTLITK